MNKHIQGWINAFALNKFPGSSLCFHVKPLFLNSHSFQNFSKMTGDNNKNYQFTQKTNPTTGRWEWVAELKDEHDYFTGNI